MTSTATLTAPSATALDAEKADVLAVLAQHRALFRQTTDGLTEEQARLATSVSRLTVGGLVKHVTKGEREWCRFLVEGPSAMAMTPDSYADHEASFDLADGETLAGVLADYEVACAETDALVRSLDSFDVSQPLPEAPWFEPGARWTARRVFAHILAETAQHAGHADIIREGIDGAKTMG